MPGTKSDISTWPGRLGAAQLLGCSPELVTALSAQGRVRFVATRLGKLYDPEDLRRLKAERDARAEHRAV